MAKPKKCQFGMDQRISSGQWSCTTEEEHYFPQSPGVLTGPINYYRCVLMWSFCVPEPIVYTLDLWPACIHVSLSDTLAEPPSDSFQSESERRTTQNLIHENELMIQTNRLKRPTLNFVVVVSTSDCLLCVSFVETSTESKIFTHRNVRGGGKKKKKKKEFLKNKKS